MMIQRKMARPYFVVRIKIQLIEQLHIYIAKYENKFS